MSKDNQKIVVENQDSNPGQSTPSFIDKLESEIRSRNSIFSLILGLLVILVIGLLVINYFKKSTIDNLGPAQSTTAIAEISKSPEVTKAPDQTVATASQPSNLPIHYTIKSGDTLFLLSQSFYNNGSQYPILAQANNLANPDFIEAGQDLYIPNLDQFNVLANSSAQGSVLATGKVTTWGPVITTDTYTVVPGDWLSKIASRAYGDITLYNRIAQANNIANPNLIIPGMKLKIPR